MNWVIIVFVQTIGSYDYDNIYLELPAFQTNYVFSEYKWCADKAAELKVTLSEDIENIFYIKEPSSKMISAWPSFMPSNDDISFKCVPY